MSTDMLAILGEARKLPIEQRRELADLLLKDIDEQSQEGMGEEELNDVHAPPIWKVAVELGATVSNEEWAKVPTDLSKNLDRYLYGLAEDEE